MINQVQQSSNQYGFYAVPKPVQPKKKYRQTYEEESKYSDEEVQNQNQFEYIEREKQDQFQLERDYYVDQAPYPDFKPKERGLDYGVQIQRQDLFDFDLQVQPLVEILVGRSVVTAINQLQQQKEKGQRTVLLDSYQKKRNAQLMQTQRLETKHNRKLDEAKRRVLQKQTFVKNKKITTKKLIARKNAKHGLLNLRQQIIDQLEQQGFLRQSTYLSLRVQYESWLYEQIKGIVNQYKKVEQTAQNLIKQKQKQVKDQHQKNIDKQNKRRKQILEQRERIRKENQERKLKKRIRKQRLHLNSQRAVKFNQASQLLQKYQPTEKILKAQSITNGLTKKKNSSTTVHIAGGLLNFVLAILNNSGHDYSPAEIQSLLEKILHQLSAKLEIQVSAQHMASIQEFKSKMQADPITFMNQKQIWIEELITKIGLELSLLQATGISIKSKLHNSILTALMNIYLNVIPAPKMEGEQIIASYQATDKDKKRQELKAKIQLIPLQMTSMNNIKAAQNVIRVRFEKIRPEEELQKKQELQKNEEQPVQKPIDLDQWIDIYDGQGWQRDKQKQLKEAPREGQQAATYVLTGFDNTFVMDQRNLFYLESELEKLLGVKGGQQMKKYRDRLEHLHHSNEKIPIFDIQLKWE